MPKRLGDIFEIARGGSPRPIEKFITNDSNGLNWVKIGDASASGKYIERTKEKIKPEGLSKTRAVSPGDFLLTNSMSFGRPYIMATDGCIHDGWLVLKPRDRKLVHPDYFYHLLSSDEMYRKFASRAGGSTVKNLNSEIVSSVEVCLPPLDEQRRIAAILDKADALRRKRKRALDLLDGLTQSIFLEMFGNLVEGQEFPRCSLSKWIADFDTGKNLAPDPDTERMTGYRVLKVSAVTTGIFRPSEVKPLPVSYVPPERHLIKAGDLLFSRANTAELIGATALVTSVPPLTVLPDKIWRFRWRTDCQPNPIFVNALFGSPSFRHQISRRATGTSGSMKNISKEKVLSMEIGQPPRPLQDEFVERIDRVNLLRKAASDARGFGDSLFASLQSRAFSGQL